MITRADPAPRRHRILAHTADAGLEASGPTLPVAFEEAAAALAELSADVAPSSAGNAREPIAIEGVDLVALAFRWLDELIGLVDVHGALVDATVDDIDTWDGVWRLRGSASFVPFDGRGVRRRADIKSATYHRLEVGPVRGGWSVTAYVDL